MANRITITFILVPTDIKLQQYGRFAHSSPLVTRRGNNIAAAAMVVLKTELTAGAGRRGTAADD
jgi:hypothetical protein